MKKIIFIILFISLMVYSAGGYKPKNISQENLTKIAKKYGKKAKRRVVIWDKMLQKAKKYKKIVKKLKAVNDYFNKIKYMSDKKVWKKKDYWASPFEFMGVGAGDCEDFAIAKYFALRALNISDKKLKITYVKLKHRNGRMEAHMVLNYYHKPTSTPIVLDNANKALKLASKRKDLKPIYSFNASGLWQAQNKSKKLKSKGKNKLKKWQSMMSRI
jgi:predicted transglutaminase-like cysteine proteinase